MNDQAKIDTRYETNRQKILEEAYRIVLHQGIDQLSMRSIATAVKSSPANLYEYFTSKDEIVYELHTKLLNDLVSHLKTVDCQLSPNEYLEQLGIAYLDFAQRHSALFNLNCMGITTSRQIWRSSLPCTGTKKTAIIAHRRSRIRSLNCCMMPCSAKSLPPIQAPSRMRTSRPWPFGR